ncbi:hypothetical protein Micbo1qcDRAFT_139744 [Microdochium bolleyi]|uniref:F-box domain-containing protein n=1 Tax=Microdochium bolleyi TaxID=196109 RepID=A0A136IPN8_9PEZI|nr:hypothetical protein Micbo1qcDRAFT_139744 [Microdochium bolleyi]
MDSRTPRQGREQQLPYVQKRSGSPTTSSAQRPLLTTSETLPYTVNVHNPTVSYGGIDPEIEENIQFISDVSDHGLRVPGTHFANNSRGQSSKRRLSPSPFRSAKGEKPMSTIMGLAESYCSILKLPSELLDAILSYLSPLELAAVSLTCKKLNQSACTDIHWQRHVLANLRGNHISTPKPCESWRELYAAHDPHWFLPKYRIWFCDRELTGNLIVVRYNSEHGYIEGCRLVVARQAAGVETWATDSDVHIHYFKPIVRLHTERPVLRLNARRGNAGVVQHSNSECSEPRGWSAECSMHLNGVGDPRQSKLLLTKCLEEDDYHNLVENAFPYGNAWPPPCVPATDRVIGKPTGLHRQLAPGRGAEVEGWTAKSREEMSEMTFRIRHWLDLGSPSGPVGEEFSTYSTLDPSLYTPTAEKPWRGIWVGDYSGHGCEFLLINQPEVDGESDEEPLERHRDESEEDFEERFQRERVHRGRLEAIKLTGDPNVPRGEYTFVADDIGPRGLVGVAQEAPFQGARIVKSRGHIAAEGFYHDKYMASQLILVSHNRIAQHWVGFGHISFFERVEIDQFLVPQVEEKKA